MAVLKGDTINGVVQFSQNGCGQPVLVTVNITGLTEGDHGFHVHQKGDLTDGCLSLAAHYNPDKVKLYLNKNKNRNFEKHFNVRQQLNHGAPNDEIRHVGDLGNIRADRSGVAYTVFNDNLISLTGSRSIIGRGLIVHQGVDDLGKGGHPDSLSTGNAGGRAACGVIGYS